MILSNIYEIIPKEQQFPVQVVPYTKEVLDELRQNFNSTYSFFRNSDEIIAVWMEGNHLKIGKERLITWKDSPEICERASRHLLFRTFVRQLPGLKPLDFSPLRFLSRKERHDVIRSALPHDLQDVAFYRRLNELNVRRIVKERKLISGVTINIDHFWGLTLTGSQMVDKGFDLCGRLVSEVRPIPGLESLLSPDESIIGEVESASRETIVVNDSGEQREVDASLIRLRRSPYDILDFIEYVTDRPTRYRVEQAWRGNPPLTSKPSELLNEQTAIAEYLGQWEFIAASGFSFSVSEKPMVCDNQLSIKPTVFRFDPSPGSTHQKPASGLFKHGPYDERRFTPKSPNILVLCDSTYRAGFSNFAHALENGVSESRYFQRGLRDLYSLQDINWHFVEVPIEDTEELRSTIQEHLKASHVDYDLAFVQGDDADTDSPIIESSYFTAKSTLMAAGIPVQAVQPERTRLAGDDLGNILGNLALQVYAKLGGTPWTVESSGSVDHEIVIGVGHSLEKNANGSSNRVVGITTVFSSDGTFLVSRTTNAVDYDGYFGALLEELTLAIESLSQEFAWKNGASVRIVFHVFKPMKMVEVDVISSLIGRFSQFNILFAFVTIALEHPFLLYDSLTTNTRRKRQVKAPERLTNAVIDNHAALIHLRGASQKLVFRHGYPRASLIRIHPSSTFTDLHYIVQQVVDFSQLSWRSFFPSYIPVTVLYSNLIAKMLQRLSKIPGWNPVCLAGSLKRKKWFL